MSEINTTTLVTLNEYTENFYYLGKNKYSILLIAVLASVSLNAEATSTLLFSILPESFQMKIFSRHDAIKNGMHTSLLLYFSAPSGSQLASNRTPFSGEKQLMTIPLKRREYLRATHFTSPDLFLGDGGRVHLHRK